MKIKNDFLERKQKELMIEHSEVIKKEIISLIDRNGGAFCFDNQSWKMGIITVKQRKMWCKEAAKNGELDFVIKDGKWWVAKKED